jgi:hypothetical protein
MLELFFLLLGTGIGGGIVFVRERVIHVEKKRQDEQKYRELWSNSLDLMAAGGQLTDEQITSLKPLTAALNRPRGSTFDRRLVEIARAEKGLPPADNLRGMSSFDRRLVMDARIKHGTAT